MKIQKSYNIFLLVCLWLGLLWLAANLAPQQAIAQQTQALPEPTPATQPESQATAQPGPQQTEETKRAQRLQELRKRSQQDDIATASYFELQQLGRELGIPPSSLNGNIESLRAALYQKLQISAPAANEPKAEDLVIRIESAQKAKAFTIERRPAQGDGAAAASEDYLKISGGIKVFITDKKEGYEHSVFADSIVLNRDQNTIRAEGQVTYIKTKLGSKDDKDTEKFTGDSLIFRLRVWRGIILYGIFSRSQTAETPRPANIHSSSSNPEKTKSDPNANNDKDSLLGKGVLATNEIRYYFDGKKMRKGSDNVLVLEKGAISTSEREQNEYFRMSFHRLWIFGKPEWAMLSATLYVGHIPVLYLPYYYHNDSQVLFHPVFGIREAYGEFVQTTTYLLGTPKAAGTDSLSFLPVSSGDPESSDFTLDALYLVPTGEKDKDKKQENKLGKDTYLKFLLDYYTYIGLFTGFDGQFRNIFKVINSIDFQASLAYAYAIENRSGGEYTKDKPFIRGEDGRYRLVPIEGNFFGQSIPFRFGLNMDLKSKKNIFSLSFQDYSDPYYRRDYLNRKENFNWIGYALERAQRNVDNLLEEWRKKNAAISSYKWQLGLNLRPKFNNPLLQSIIRSFDLKLYIAAYFSKKTDSERKTYDPTRDFFYPTKILLPDTSLRISGTLWPPPAKKTQSAKQGELPILQDWKYKPPPKTQNSEQEPDATEGNSNPNPAKNPASQAAIASAIERPKGLKKIPQEQQVKNVSFQATYSISLQNLMQSQTENKDWQRVTDIELNNKELHFTGKEAFQLVTQWKFLDSLLSVSLKHNLAFNVAHYFDLEEGIKSSNDLKATKQANKWSWKEQSDIVLKPLRSLDWFSNSSISHTIQAKIYDYQYDKDKDAHEGTFLDLNLADKELRKRIPNHRLASQLYFQPIQNAYNPINNLSAKLSFSNELPPSEPKNTLKTQLFFELFQWSHDLSLELQQEGEDDPEYYAQPLSYISIYKPLDKLELKNVLVYNFADKKIDREKNIEPHFAKEEISFRAWWFSGGLYFRYTQPYTWDTKKNSWRADGDKDLIADQIFLSLDWTTKDYYFWKNRILFYFTFKTKWDQDLVRYNRKSSLTMDFRFSFFIHEFLNIQIVYRMSNEKMFLYYPGMKDLLGLQNERSLLEDLWYSINFWDADKQRQGLFKMKDLRVLVIHHLKDWDFIFEFVGKPQQIKNKLSWDYAIGLYLRWIPIPLIKRRASFEKDTWKTDAR